MKKRQRLIALAHQYVADGGVHGCQFGGQCRQLVSRDIGEHR